MRAAAADRAGAAGALADPDLGWKAALALVIALITLIGGRIIPSFTRNWLQQRGVKTGLPSQPTSFDNALLLSTLLVLAAWASGVAPMVTGVLLVAVAFGHAVRLARWSGWRTAAEPLLLILHVGYAWIAIGVALLGLSLLGDVSRTAGVHALTVGAVATMILSVMSRATRGHTGRALIADPMTTIMFVAITGSAIIRTATALGWVVSAAGWAWSGTLWIAALTLFLIVYGPMLLGPRADGRR